MTTCIRCGGIRPDATSPSYRSASWLPNARRSPRAWPPDAQSLRSAAGLAGRCLDGQSGGRRQRRPSQVSSATQPAAEGRAGLDQIHSAEGDASSPEPGVAGIVTEKLRRRWSPQQIAGWLKTDLSRRPGDAGVAREHLRTLFIQSRGALRKELTAICGPSRVIRRSTGPGCPMVAATGPGIINITERPAEAEDRAVPGHWRRRPGLRQAMTPVATLVERSTRPDAGRAARRRHKADSSPTPWPRRSPPARAVGQVAVPGTRTTRWPSTTGSPTRPASSVYFCDPKSPWQRGSNENTNGLLRQVPPRTTRLQNLTQDDLDAIAMSSTDRPRQTLGFKTPSQALAEVLR